MNYKLAKLLKDAGFHQSILGTHFAYTGKKLDDPIDDVYIPTLSELIEAVISVPKGKNMGFYSDGGNFVAWKRVTFENDGNDYQGNGDTPEEAVANLWLTLNKK